MILGKPTPSNKNNFICVNSKTSIILHKNNFIPYSRELGSDRIYYNKTNKLLNFIKENNLSIIKTF